MSVRVALVDDHEIVSFAIAAAIETTDRLTYWGVAPTVDDLLARDPHPDLVVLDLRLADGSSPIGNVDKLRAAGSTVVAFTSGENPYLVRLAARAAVLLATGSKSFAIASSLGIAVSTVDDYVRRIRAKYARAGRPALTRIDLYKRALEDGFLPLPGAER
jgi:two-component system response regulator DevR